MANDWQRDELLLALRLYCSTAFGKLHKTNPDIIHLANVIGRTPSAVAMKACNFASLDPSIPQKGMSKTSSADRALWNEFMENSTDIADQAEALYESRVLTPDSSTPNNQFKEFKIPTGETETIREIKTRRVQSFFRRSVLQSYNHRCAVSGLAVPQLLIASHITPWAENENQRANPSNGIALNALYDKAFDRHLISFDENFALVISQKLKQQSKDKVIRDYFLDYEGKILEMPHRFYPDVEALKKHRLRMMEIADG